MSEDFRSRWSRRKLEVRRESERPPEAPAPEEAEAAEREQALTPEEIEALPPVEELTAGSDFSLFLRKGVPEALKKAALRRMWSLDPAIRDYVGDARDYAFDWNLPGGVPGNGPLLPTDDVPAMLRRVLNEEPAKEPGAPAAGEVLPAASPEAAAERPASGLRPPGEPPATPEPPRVSEHASPNGTASAPSSSAPSQAEATHAA